MSGVHSLLAKLQKWRFSMIFSSWLVTKARFVLRGELLPLIFVNFRLLNLDVNFGLQCTFSCRVPANTDWPVKNGIQQTWFPYLQNQNSLIYNFWWFQSVVYVCLPDLPQICDKCQNNRMVNFSPSHVGGRNDQAPYGIQILDSVPSYVYPALQAYVYDSLT